ncbi:MAG: gliding motility protein GldM [Bacteroidetes bacterium]|nr:gliding motility protein GldM [Bacteroidota bacterium]
MAGGKETPRQKMIGMMYLVLTALLAMNVSKDILDAFIIVNGGLERTNANFEKKNEKTYTDFKAALEKDKAKTQPYYDRAMTTKKLAGDLVRYIDDMKKNLIAVTDKKPKEVADTTKLKNVESKDNYDEPTRVLIGPEPSKPIEGDLTATALKKRIADLRSGLLQLFNDEKLFLPGKKKEMEGKIGLETPDFGVVNGVKESWESGNFYHLPLAAVITNLSKMQNDVRNAEADVLTELFLAVKGKDFTFDKLTAKVIAPSSYILAGDDYKADVLLVAFNSTQNPKIIVGAIDTTKKGEDANPLVNADTTVLTVEGGMGKYVKATGGEGLQKWSGVIQVEKPGGGFSYYPFSSEYMVAKPAAAVSPDKMNVFYIGVDNPVSITAAGVSPEQLAPSGSNCTISGSKGKYTVRVTTAGEATINVMAKFGSTSKSMGSFKFRIKTVPNPIAMIVGKRDGDIVKKSELLSASTMIAKLENFDFDLPATITEFGLSLNYKGQLMTLESKSSKLTTEMMTVLKSVPPGTKLFFESVKANVAGTTRKIGGINLKVQ